MSRSFRTIRQDFPYHLRKLRESRGLNQADLAERAGLQPSAVAHFESGRRMPAAANVVALAGALDVSTDHLLGYADRAEVSGDTADRVLRIMSRMSTEDCELLLAIAKLMARRGAS